MEWAVLGLSIMFVIVTYIVVQGTRAAMAWRKAAAAGDVKVIAEIVENTVSGWRSMKRPKEVPPDVWRGIQSMELVDVGPEFVRVACQAEGSYKRTEGRWVEIASPLQEGMSITSRAAEMLLYELPHFTAGQIQIDIYTTFREAAGPTERACILSTAASREMARSVDWEEWTSAEIVDALGGRYRVGDSGEPLPIEVAESSASQTGNMDAPSATAKT